MVVGLLVWWFLLCGCCAVCFYSWDSFGFGFLVCLLLLMYLCWVVVGFGFGDGAVFGLLLAVAFGRLVLLLVFVCG